MDEEVKCYVKAGEIAKEVVDFTKDFVKHGMKLIEIANAIDDKINELGGTPAFPVNLSLDEIAAHYTPVSNDDTIAEGILKIDIGVCVEGFIADTAFSMDLTEEKKYEKMMEVNQLILEEISKIIKTDSKVFEVGTKAQEILNKYNEENKTNFSMIKSLSGHELGKDIIHAGLTIPNYKNENTTELKNKAFAVEPFVTSGAGDVYEGKGGGIFVLKRDTPVRDKDSREILTFIKKNYKTRPFCIRWLEKAGLNRIRFVIPNLVNQGILYEYPLLIEKSKAPVSQFEHTFLIRDEKVFRTTG